MKPEMEAVSASDREKLMITYSVHISEASLAFAAQIVQDHKLLLDVGIVKLVEKACRRLRQELDSDYEAAALDWDEYCLDRVYVEFTESMKEKDSGFLKNYSPRIEKEFIELKSKWEDFEKKWLPVVSELRQEVDTRVCSLTYLRQAIVRTKSLGHVEADSVTESLTAISDITTQLIQSIPKAFQEKISVQLCLISQVACSLTGLPVTSFLSPLKLISAVEDIESRLCKAFIGLDNAIHVVTSALSKQRSSTSPLGSFLFLGKHGSGRTTIAKALGKELYGQEERFLKIDMSKFKEQDVLSRLLDVLNREKKYGSVVMFDNIENAHSSAMDILCQILKDKRLVDDGELCADLTHDLVLISSHIGHEVLRYCECLRHRSPTLPFKDFLKEPALGHVGRQEKTCNLLGFFSKVTDELKPELINLVDDVVVFPYLVEIEHKAISTVQIREIAISMGSSLRKQIILYPSSAVIHTIVTAVDIDEKGARGYEAWTKEELVPKLRDAIEDDEAKKSIIIYMDELLGFSHGYSFRVETNGHLEKNQSYKNFKANILKLRAVYRREKQHVNKMYRLKSRCFDLLGLLNMKAETNVVSVKAEEAIRLIDDLLINGPSDLEMAPLKGTMDSECSQVEKIEKRAKTDLSVFFYKLQNSLGSGAISVITEALMSCLQTPYDVHVDRPSRPKSFLFLGLTPHGKEQLSIGLGEKLTTELGERLLIQVNLSHCTQPNSFFRCICVEDSSVRFMEVVKKIRQSVIVLYRLEMAHSSVFSDILSILDYGVLKDNDGSMIDFGGSILVIVSDCGNKEAFAALNGHFSEPKLPPIRPTEEQKAAITKTTYQKDLKGLRAEILFSVGELLIFDPQSDDQLNHFFYFPLKPVPKPKSFGWFICFDMLFNEREERAYYKFRYFTMYDLVERLKAACGDRRLGFPEIPVFTTIGNVAGGCVNPC